MRKKAVNIPGSWPAWREEAKRRLLQLDPLRLPPTRFVLLAGAMKAGSTSLYQQMIQHPQIIANGINKETDYFSVRHDKGFDWYRSQWRMRDPANQWALDASVSYSKFHQFPDVYQNIAAAPGAYRLIFILRDPVERMLSHYRHLVSRGYRKAELVKQSEKHVLRVSSYAAQLDHLRAELPDTPLHLLTLEHFRQDPLAEMHRVAQFLEIDPDFAFTPIPPQNVRRADNGANTVTLLADERERLAHVLADDMRKLARDYGLDISLWPSARLCAVT